jgi:transposase
LWTSAKASAVSNWRRHQRENRVIPAKITVIVNVRPKYACRACEQQGTANRIRQAPVPPSIIPKGYATPSLILQIITSKYQYGLPLYRLESMFAQYGIELCKQTMSKWMVKNDNIFEIIYNMMRRILLEQPVVFGDDITVKVVGDQ